MKKRNQLFILIVLSVLFSCSNVKRDTSKKETDSIAKIITPTQTPANESLGNDSTKTKKYDDALLGINYFFSNDTLCQNLSIKEISKNAKLKIPEKLEFKLLLHDKQHKYDDKIFEGVAQLSSSEESFYNNSDKDGGDYFAADYNLDAADYKMQIRLDIQNYEACVFLVTTSQPDKVLGGYSAYLKKFPNEGIMKRGKCK